MHHIRTSETGPETGPASRAALRPATKATAVVGTLLAALLLSGCTAFGGTSDVPEPTRSTATDSAVQGRGTGATPEADADADATASDASQAVPTGTVVAETDAVSKTGETSIHVRVVANEDGSYDAQFSGYRTTNPQPMTVEFRRSADYGAPRTQAVGQVTWQADTEAPAGVGLSEAGAHPDWLHTVVLVPAESPEGQSDADRPWVGAVLAVGTLQWNIPQPYPNLRATAGKDRPGAYGTVSDRDGVPATYRVASGDDTATVAERFGLTRPQLQWLNPTLALLGNELYEGSALNLDPAAR